MSKAAEAWMPLYIGDYLGGTQRLTTEQHGAYFLLIIDYWRNGPAPDDDATLRQITRLDAASWKRHRPALARLFQIDGGEWRHKRIEAELVSAQSNQERRSSKARAAAQARWDNATSNAPSMSQALHVECPPPSPSPSTNVDSDVAAATSQPRKRGVRLPEDWLPEKPYPQKVQDLSDLWPPGREDRELDGFRDYWTSRAKDAAKSDWNKAWHNRIRDQHDRIMRENRNGHGTNQPNFAAGLRGSRPDPSLDLLRAARAAEDAAERASDDYEADRGDGYSISPFGPS